MQAAYVQSGKTSFCSDSNVISLRLSTASGGYKAACLRSVHDDLRNFKACKSGSADILVLTGPSLIESKAFSASKGRCESWKTVLRRLGCCGIGHDAETFSNYQDDQMQEEQYSWSQNRYG